ncbi:MAG: transglycosylase domain protein [Chthoniobacteraceae bacterium]|nr:transglycosylase domain protein [Chthoniobacteraceae bacterium]
MKFIHRLLPLALCLACHCQAQTVSPAKSPIPGERTLPNTSANGTQAAINNGIETKSGWNPPLLPMKNLRTISIDEFCRTFPDAAKYKPFFIAAGKKYKINPTLLAAIAMEESHCDPGVSDSGNPANAGGIMQIQGQEEKGAPDPATNIMQGAHELRRHLEESKQNVLEAIGSYNGWQKGLVVKTMITPPWGGASMNLDYVHQVVNGWCQGVEGYSIGSFNKKYNPTFGDQFK